MRWCWKTWRAEFEQLYDFCLKLLSLLVLTWRFILIFNLFQLYPFLHTLRCHHFHKNKNHISIYRNLISLLLQTLTDMEFGDDGASDLPPVAPEGSGEGLPYAPENFPNSGDIWRWKAGQRISSNGNFRDRYLYLPRRLAASHRGGFKSKLAVERYVKEFFPDASLVDFFASFSWSIPSGLPGISFCSLLILFLIILLINFIKWFRKLRPFSWYC